MKRYMKKSFFSLQDIDIQLRAPEGAEVEMRILAYLSSHLATQSGLGQAVPACWQEDLLDHGVRP